jgi:hypothetical protein
MAMIIPAAMEAALGDLERFRSKMESQGVDLRQWWGPYGVLKHNITQLLGRQRYDDYQRGGPPEAA